MRKTLIILTLFFVFALYTNVMLYAATDGDEVLFFDAISNVKFVNKILDHDKIDETLAKYDAVFLYRTTNRDDENIPVANFIFKYSGKTLYKNYFTTQESSKVIKKEVKEFAKNASFLVENPKEIFKDDDTMIFKSTKLLNLAMKSCENSKLFYVANKDRQSIQKLASISDDWALNPVIHSAEKAFAPYGKINYTMKYYEVIALNHYFTRVESHVEFIPGKALSSAGVSGYNPYYIKDSAFHKVSLQTYQTDYNIGDEPKGIDYWPINGTGVYTVSSAWGLNATVGYSQKDGFNGNIVGGFSRNTTYELSDPEFNAMQITIHKKFSWAYSNFTSKTRDKTNHHFPGIIVEQKTDTPFYGDFKIYQEFYMRVDRSFLHKAHELTWNVWNSKEGQYGL
ncbi:MAG: hypothetical protein WC225_04490 [Acholeplasmataceae bacterium]|nr:hypothetical protein [Acholeplasmataceae bacterium]